MKEADAIVQIAEIASGYGLRVEVGVHQDRWYDLCRFLRCNPRQEGPNRAPYFMYDTVRVEITQGLRR